MPNAWATLLYIHICKYCTCMFPQPTRPDRHDSRGRHSLPDSCTDQSPGDSSHPPILGYIHCPNLIAFPRYNMKCGVENVIQYYAEYFMWYLAFLYISCYIAEI